MERLVETLQALSERTARIDERLGHLAERADALERKLDALLDVSNRVGALEQRLGVAAGNGIHKLEQGQHESELRLQRLELSDARTASHWATLADFGLKILWTVAAGYLLYRLGLQAPPGP